MSKVTNVSSKQQLSMNALNLKKRATELNENLESIKSILTTVKNYDGIDLEGAALILSNSATNVSEAMNSVSLNISNYIADLIEYDVYDLAIDDEMNGNSTVGGNGISSVVGGTTSGNNKNTSLSNNSTDNGNNQNTSSVNNSTDNGNNQNTSSSNNNMNNSNNQNTSSVNNSTDNSNNKNTSSSNNSTGGNYNSSIDDVVNDSDSSNDSVVDDSIYVDENNTNVDYNTNSDVSTDSSSTVIDNTSNNDSIIPEILTGLGVAAGAGAAIYGGTKVVKKMKENQGIDDEDEE